jgi:hypothetical protein
MLMFGIVLATLDCTATVEEKKKKTDCQSRSMPQISHGAGSSRQCRQERVSPFICVVAYSLAKKRFTG